MNGATGSPLQRALALVAVALVGSVTASILWLAIKTTQLENRIRLLEARDERAKQAESEQFVVQEAPLDSYEVFAIAKQWIWKFQHPNGAREVDQLHLPAGRAIKLSVISEDVIHRLDVPELGIKVDSSPGRYTTVWGSLSKIGRFEFSCGQYCGTNHVKHKGHVTVLEAAAFDRWLNKVDDNLRATDGSLAAKGRKIFLNAQCSVCHTGQKDARGPSLEGRFGGTSKLKDGSTVVFDSQHIRQSILHPKAQIADGFEPIMPQYDIDKLSEEGLIALVEFLKALKPGDLPRTQDERFPMNPRLEGLKSLELNEFDRRRREQLRK